MTEEEQKMAQDQRRKDQEDYPAPGWDAITAAFARRLPGTSAVSSPGGWGDPTRSRG